MELDRRSMLKILGGCTVTGFLQTWTKQNRSYADVATATERPAILLWIRSAPNTTCFPSTIG